MGTAIDHTIQRLFVGGPKHGESMAISGYQVRIPRRERVEFAALPTLRHCAEMDEVKALTGLYQHNLIKAPKFEAAVYERVRFRIRGLVLVFFAHERLQVRTARHCEEFWSLAVDAHFIWRRRQRVAEAHARSARPQPPPQRTRPQAATQPAYRTTRAISLEEDE